jgi:hypothetical protein
MHQLQGLMVAWLHVLAMVAKTYAMLKTVATIACCQAQVLNQAQRLQV